MKTLQQAVDIGLEKRERTYIDDGGSKYNGNTKLKTRPK